MARSSIVDLEVPEEVGDYGEVAAVFMMALLPHYEKIDEVTDGQVAARAFDLADAFMAELRSRLAPRGEA